MALSGCAARTAAAPLPGASPAASDRDGAQAARGDTLPARARGDERELLDLVNAERRREHLAPLAWDERAAAVARAHSRDMLQRGEIGHESPTTGSPADRVHAAGIRAPLILENVAFAPTVRQTHDGLMHSPGHRANILSAEATHLGVGVVLDPAHRDALYVTQVFLRELGRVDVAATRARLRALIAERRREAGVAPARDDPALDRVAQSLASAAAAHRGAPSEEERRALVGPATQRFGRTRAVTAVVADASSVASSDDVVEPCSALAVGVVQGPHPELGDNALYVVVLLAGAG